MYHIIYFRDLNHEDQSPISYQNVLRIPEVFVRIRQAQALLERKEDFVDLQRLLHLLSICELPDQRLSPDLWSKVTMILQLGLCDRYLKSQDRACLFVSHAHNDFVARVSCGLLSLEEALQQRSWQDGPVRQLSLFKPREYEGDAPVSYERITDGIKTAEGLMEYAHIYQVSQMVVIGPTEPLALSSHDFTETDWLLSEIANSAVLSDKIEVIESIDSDPLLFWFWRDYNKATSHKVISRDS